MNTLGTKGVVKEMVNCLFVLYVLLWSTEVSRASTASTSVLLQCVSRNTKNFKLSIISHRNKTGHWTAQHRIGDGNSENQETAPTEIDIDQTIRKCEGGETVLIVATVTASPMAPATRTPFPGYELMVGLGYYKLHSSVRNWMEASNVCRQENAHLLIINSEAEAKAMQPLWVSHPTLGDWRDSWSFVGIHDQFEEGKFVTIFNQPLNEAGYSKWSPVEPSAAEENCGMVNYHGEFGDAGCNTRMSFFCEQEL